MGQEPGLSPALVARLAKQPEQHKYDHGHALILGGGVGHGGAARLAARAALRVGAGLVTLGCPPAALIENAAQLNAVMLRAIKGQEGLEEVLTDDRINALCLGPGFGTGEKTRAQVKTVLKSGRPAVLDADALTSFQDAPDDLFAVLHGHVVLTPHDGEFARLFPAQIKPLQALRDEKLENARRKAVQDAATKAGCTVLLKGAVTLIAAPTGQTAEVRLTGEHAAPWLATAGAGDVLAGLVTGLLARGFSTVQAAETAAGLHGAAARAVGPGLIAEDLPDALPDVFRALGL